MFGGGLGSSWHGSCSLGTLPCRTAAAEAAGRAPDTGVYTALENLLSQLLWQSCRRIQRGRSFCVRGR